ncbi:hypothetical protein H7169_01750 [Candidatus Gracilibacteria bacterium]|nr:hypothetical protein [Candidatus Gracilibacteria bacterium]
MQLTQKHIIAISAVAVLAIFVYLAVQNNTPSQSDTGVETDTVKRLKTVSKLNTGLRMSPFGSGKPLTEADKPLQKLEFKKANLE